ncbi:MAG: cyclic nucleotide-binding domain-containing protein [bacterium]|nr:cyclic nucleotide-binding domain-containing protein [bacterium]
MGQSLKLGTINQLEEGKILYQEGERLESVALVLKGNVICANSGMNMVFGPGEFIGVNDLYIGSYSGTAKAGADCVVYAIEASGMEQIPSIINIKQEYRGYLIKSLNRYLIQVYETYYSVLGVANDTLSQANEVMKQYSEIIFAFGGEAETVYALEKLEAYTKELPVKPEWIQTIKEMQAIPIDVMSSYYSYIPVSSLREIEEKIKICTILMNAMKHLTAYVTNVSDLLISDGSDCVFKAICRSVITLAPSHANYSDMIELVDRTVELVNKLEEELEKRAGKATIVNRAQMEALYYSIISGTTQEEIMEDEETEQDILRSFENSLQQILSYGEIETETRNKYTDYMERFIALKDKNSTADEVRELRHSMTGIFFYIYKKVFLKAYHSGSYDKAVKLFLQFGFMDERLLSKEQLLSLSKLKVKNTMTHYCNCYTIFDWLVEIYEGRKEPSKSEMDLDYRDYIRQMTGKGKLTPQEERQYMEDYDAKLDFELSNMFQHNMKLTNGKVSTYVPFLYEDIMPLNIEKYFLTPTKIDEAIRDIIAIDFSAFYREVIFSDPSIGIQREILQKEYLPDVLLYPTCGTNGIMWQETANKSRESAARFCVAILSEANLQDTMIHLIARFRWELCRTLQGYGWNDIANKCLTAEYNDYIQFYRRNKELSEDKKEKLKQQIQKARNNTRECFVIDYEQWIKFEINGSVRLNKCARDILATYCPFNKQIREGLSSRQQYQDDFFKYEKEAKAKARILDAKILSLKKNGMTVPKELESTAAYYNNK